MDNEKSRAHNQKMAKKKTARDKIMAKKDTEGRGLLIVHTGKGKGKTTAALGMALRCIGHDMKVGVVQFIKGAWDTAERRVLENLGDGVVFKAMGEGFSWETQDRDRDIACAKAALEEAKKMLADETFSMVILDEINVAIKSGVLDLDDVLVAIEKRPALMHVVMTGRNASEELIERADLVTEMMLLKHPLRSGIKAQPGVEF
jgi:cob(I)alamin adenosyltransferase